ncbi:MAG: glycogen/starch synthase [Fervidobacterium sp.]|uniref:glycogen synthase n=1 Tax=Fervidobacterium TaxID=2422 RepID=UPI0022097EB4|nr:glycogen synthase [Fervidobacterium riparium]
MRIAMVSYEVYPFAKVGGLADVVGALPKYLERQGVTVDIYMPYHKKVDENAAKFGYTIEKLSEGIELPVLSTTEKFDIYKTKLPGTKDVNVFLIANEYYFSADEVYAGPDLAEQAIFFSNAVLEAVKKLNFTYDVVHVNDWQTALIPVYMKTVYRNDDLISRAASMITIHNLGYQGIYEPSYMRFAGLPDYLFNIDGLEFYGKMNFLKGGIIFSDIINTVSPTYAREIQTKEYGEKLDGVLRMRSSDLYGILNGIDYEEYNPATDKRIYVNYDLNTIEKKKENKRMLQKELGLPERDVPVIGMINRLVVQKGLDIMAEIMDYVSLLDIQFVLLGTGDEEYEEMFKKLGEKYPDKYSINLKFDVVLAQKIYAGSDMFLMPSRYEPCGLGQMYSLRYGTIPIVRYTGGLADTVKEYDPITKEGTGFGFEGFDPAHLFEAIAKAVYFYNDKEHWGTLIRNAMSTDLTWDSSAKEYVKLYQRAKSKVQ